MGGNKLELTKEMVDLLKRSTDGHQFWGEYLERAHQLQSRSLSQSI